MYLYVVGAILLSLGAWVYISTMVQKHVDQPEPDENDEIIEVDA